MGMGTTSLVRRIHELLSGARPSSRSGVALVAATNQLQGRVERIRARGCDYAAVRISKHVAALRDENVSDRVEGHPVSMDGRPGPSLYS